MSARAALLVLVGAAGCGSNDDFPPLPEPTYPTAAEVDAQLAGLSFADFLEQSYGALLVRDPESLTDLGLSAAFDRHDNLLDDESDAFLLGTYDVAEVIRTRLATYDRQALAAADRVSRDVYAWYLDDLVGERPFVHQIYMVNGGLTSEEERLLSLFTQVHPLATRADAESYIERLWRVRRRLDQAIAGLDLRTREGTLPPRGALASAVSNIGMIAALGADDSPFITSFESRLGLIAGIDSSTRDQLRGDARKAYRVSVQPALRDLASAVQRAYASAPMGDGIWAQANGDAYYAYLLHHHTTQDLTAADVHARGLAAVAALQAELQARFAALGYPAGEALLTSFTRVRNAAGVVPAANVIARYNELVTDAEGRLGPAFDVLPRAAVEVHSDPIGGYYIPGSPDGSRPGVFYAYVGPQGNPAYTMKTLIYHETVPGHHLQIALAREQAGLPTLRRALTFTAHAEGWALYAEQLAAELGFYDGDDPGDLGRLQYALLRAVRLVVDTGIHSLHWSAADALAYMSENIGFPADVYDVGSEVDRYVSWPGQATAYRVGMDAIVAARAALQARLGDAYDVRAFHHVLLEAGSLPLPVLDTLLAETTFGP